MVAMNSARFTDGDDVIKMGTLGKDPPTHVIGWRLKVTSTGAIDIAYEKVWSLDLTDGATIDYLLEAYALSPDEPRGSTPNENNPEKMNTNLSIRHKDYSYMVFITGNTNLYFTEGQEAFKVAEDDTHPDNDSFYMSPLCAWKEAGAVKIARRPGPRCRVACFIADSYEDQKHSTEEFFTSFNMYLSVELPWKSDPKRTRILPVVVDPDVGFPGGNR